MRLILNVNTEKCSKCPVYVEAKFTKKSFRLVTTRKADLLELVHLDLQTLRTQ